MTNLRRLLPFCVALLATIALADSNTAATFTNLKSLEGSWSGKAGDRDVKVTFRVTSGGSAVLSEIQAGNEDMISMFHLDGSRLMLTHYCAAGNQPRMIGTVSPDGKTIKFDFLDATNLSAQPGHMQRMTLTMVDADHHTEHWEFQEADGKTMHEESFDLHRSK